MSFIKELEKRQKEWELKKDYSKNSMEKVFNYLLVEDEKRQGGIIYNSELKKLIIEKEKLDLDFKTERYLETEIYLAQKELEKKKEKEYDEKMLKDGWIKLTEEVIKNAYQTKKRLQLNVCHTNDWVETKVEKLVRPCCFNGIWGFLPLKARSRGYFLRQFKNAYCKIID